MIRTSDLELLRCPNCKRTTLSPDGADFSPDGWIERGSLVCPCGGRWPIDRGLARLYHEGRVGGTDRLLRYFYDGFPALHDPAVRWLLPLFGSGTETAMRDGYARRLELEALRPSEDGRPIRILEVGIGTGANLRLIRRALGSGSTRRLEIWGLDLSEGMISICRRRLEASGDRDTRLVMGDVHELPFADHTFDRVFHIGAVNSFSDPFRALAEMARIAKPGTPVVVVDERLDPTRAHSPYHRAMYRLVTFYDRFQYPPRNLVPKGAVEVREEQLNRFFYCMTFRMLAPAPMAASGSCPLAALPTSCGS